MKKITLVILSLYLAFSMLSSCSNQDKGAAFLLDSNATEKAFFGVIESFTSGMIVENEPLQVRFCSGITLKKQMGEDISSDAFSIDPSVKGKAYWIDQQTIGFRFDEIPEVQKVHHVKFDLSEFIETPKDLKPFEFSFVIRQQDFDVKEVTYLCRDENTCSYELALIFSNPVDPQIVETMLDKKTINDYQCKVVAVAANEVQLTIGNIPRKKSSYNIDIKLDGSVLDIDKNLKKELFIPAINIFEPLNYSLNKKEKSITIQFSNLLNQRQDFTGFIEFSKNTSYKTEVNDNCLIIYCDNDNTIQNSFDVTILKGISDDNHRTLENDFQMKNVVLNDLVPKVKWSDDGVVVPDDKNTTIYFDAICLKSVTLRIIKIYDENVLSFLQENDLDESFNMQRVGKIEKKIKLQLENTDYSRWKTYPIKLSDYVSVSKGAMYQITLDFNREDYPFACETTNEKAIEIDEQDYWNNESYSYKSYYYEDEWWEKDDDPCHLSFYNYVEIKKNVFVSNIAVIAKTADEGVVDIFVRKISDAKPISNATVQLMDFQRQIVGEATTDKHGFCSVVYQNKPWFVVVQDSEGGKSYLKLSNNKALSMSKFDVSGTSVVHNINGFIYSNRNVWRPGDKININFMLSDKTNQLPDNFPVVLELLDANGRVRYKTVNNAPKGKIWAFEVSTDVAVATGFWTATVKVGNQKFSK
ncbi:MAG: MG2 domain-containing protein, partial [Bacteroidales bacterium]|nr:MG2 domain-containing protein [Bacteroidales bacterium]